MRVVSYETRILSCRRGVETSKDIPGYQVRQTPLTSCVQLRSAPEIYLGHCACSIYLIVRLFLQPFLQP